MTRVASVAALLWAALVAGPLIAADLTQLGRKLGKEPAYKGKPKYALLVFGPEASTRVWVALDGTNLYVDRNGDGDLTGENEKVAAKKDDEDGDASFEVGDIRDGKLTHKNLYVGVGKLDPLTALDARVEKYQASDPSALAYLVKVEMESPGLTGTGVGGRVEHTTWFVDANGFLRFADRPKDAPVINFGGPRQVTLFGNNTLTIGRQTDLSLRVGTPGVGPGTTTYFVVKGVIPENIYPKLEITYPPAKQGDKTIKEQYELKDRGWVNLDGPVGVPRTAGPGKARLHITFDAWKEGKVAPSRHEIEIVAPRPGPKPEPVSTRLAKELTHPSDEATLTGLRYSPDGRQLIAGDPVGGVIQVWDVASGKRLTRIDRGDGYLPNGDDFFTVSPDWSLVYMGRWKAVRKEKGGYQSVGDVRAWDIATGKLVETFQHDAARHVSSELVLSPDGKTFVAFNAANLVFLWDVKTRKAIPLADDLRPPAAYTPDGKTLAAHRAGKFGHVKTVVLIDTETGKEKLTIPIGQKNADMRALMFAPDGRTLIGHLQVERDEQWLKFWDAETSKEIGSIKREKSDLFEWWNLTRSPNRETMATTSWRDDKKRLFLFDVASKKLTRTVVLAEEATASKPAFSPDGRWLAVVTQGFADASFGIHPRPEEAPQPRIHLVEAATGEVRETLVCPRGFTASVCFSPDGKTLASGGHGKVQLWDVSFLSAKR